MPRAKKEVIEQVPEEVAPTPVKTSRHRVVVAKSDRVSTRADLTTKKAAKKNRSLKIDVFDLHGKVIENMTLPTAVFGGIVNQSLIAQAVWVYQTNQRQGNAMAKTRGQVTGSTKKMGRQKGGGRARHGSITAPIYVGGGKAHGPQPRDIHAIMPKHMRQAALFSALTSKLETNTVKAVVGLATIAPKTKVIAALLKNIGLTDPKKRPSILVIGSDRLPNVYKASRNIDGVTFEPVTALTTFAVVKAKHILFMKEALDVLGQKREAA